jgi:hypothetical protein
MLQTFLIFNIDMTRIFVWNTGFANLRSVMSEDSAFNRVAKSFDPLTYLAKMQPEGLIVFIFGLTSLAWLLIVSITRHDLLKKFFGYQILEAKNSIYAYLVSRILVYYEPIFHVLTILSFNMMVCDERYMMKESLSGAAGAALFVTDNEDSITSSAGAAPGNEWRSVLFVNDSCGC